ncbi:Abi-alpha family protein [Methanosarcina sp. Z-7115]|uniref:Abi-alpha family protein n=1 Tax=Methanosarcina baikalica TaxID=3073890 RepID=A0ABU2D025_9EURY|nr:Abi-alpha family protein [Methanosarcina sp. Z-7115]MDR7665319.1 Abi-alpha family protein [Methanosarcina sp. Z-7115]
MSDMEEWVKATTEGAKLATTVVEKVSNVPGFIAKYIDEPLMELAGKWVDNRKFDRWENLVKIQDKVNAILKERGCKTLRMITPKLGIPLIDQALLEDNDDLREIWCKLIANSLDPNINVEFHYAYIDIIKNLTPLDAKVLEFAYHETLRKVDTVNQESIKMYMSKIVVKLETIYKYLNVHEEELTISYHNLMRVECLRYFGQQSSIVVGEDETVPSMLNDPMWVAITPLGIALVEACMETNELEGRD